MTTADRTVLVHGRGSGASGAGSIPARGMSLHGVHSLWTPPPFGKRRAPLANPTDARRLSFHFRVRSPLDISARRRETAQRAAG